MKEGTIKTLITTTEIVQSLTKGFLGGQVHVFFVVGVEEFGKTQDPTRGGGLTCEEVLKSLHKKLGGGVAGTAGRPCWRVK